MDRLLMVLTGFSLAIIILVLVAVRKAHIRVEYSVSWLTAALLLLIVSLDDNIVQWLARNMGVEYPPVAVLLLVLGVFLVVIYRLSLRVSALKDASIALAQRVAILEFHLKSAHEEKQESENG